MDTLQRLVNGLEFDTVEAVRALAQEVVILQKQIGAAQPPGSSVAPTTASDTQTELVRALMAAGISQRVAILLTTHYKTLYDIYHAADEELTAIDGIGPGTLSLIRKKLAANNISF